ncbi:MAG: DinB family protein [Candidatus Acidiferrales bacterium]
MTSAERNHLLESYSHGPAFLSAALRQMPKKMWFFKPSAVRWSIHEIVVHLADSEALNYIRCRRFIVQPDARVPEPDVARWAGSLGYFHQSTREALEVIPRLRKMTYRLMQSIPESIWTSVIEETGDAHLTLEEWVGKQEHHIPRHIQDIRENYVEWIKSHPPRKPARARAEIISAPVAMYSTGPC